MMKVNKPTAAALILLLMIVGGICFLLNLNSDNNKESSSLELSEPEKEAPPPPPSVIDIVKSMFSLPTNLPPLLGGGPASYRMPMNIAHKLHLIIKQGRSYFCPPNLDFRDEGAEGIAEEETSGEKVKEAIVKSLDKSKETMEDSAKSAAKLAGEAMENLFSHGEGTGGGHSQSQAEL